LSGTRGRKGDVVDDDDVDDDDDEK